MYINQLHWHPFAGCCGGKRNWETITSPVVSTTWWRSWRWCKNGTYVQWSISWVWVSLLSGRMFGGKHKSRSLVRITGVRTFEKRLYMYSRRRALTTGWKSQGAIRKFIWLKKPHFFGAASGSGAVNGGRNGEKVGSEVWKGTFPPQIFNQLSEGLIHGSRITETKKKRVVWAGVGFAYSPATNGI